MRDRVTDRPLPDRLLGYKLLGLLGRGAGSSIYAARDLRDGRDVTLKHVIIRRERDRRFYHQLRTELRVGRRVDHPGLRRSETLRLRSNWLGRVKEAVLALEPVHGQALDLHPPGDIAEAVAIFAQVADAVNAMHEGGFVHCDLKPSNILRTSPTTLKVIDYGQSCRLGHVKERVQGTPDFIAPEQVKRLPVSVQTDVFNFGAMMYVVLCRKKMPTLGTVSRAENSFLVDTLIPEPCSLNPLIPLALSGLIMHCVRSNPDKRPSSLAEVRGRLDCVLRS